MFASGRWMFLAATSVVTFTEDFVLITTLRSKSIALPASLTCDCSLLVVYFARVTCVPSTSYF